MGRLRAGAGRAGYVLALGFVSPSLGVPLPLHYAARCFRSLAGMRATQRFSLVVLRRGCCCCRALGLARSSRRGVRAPGSASSCWRARLFLLEVFPVKLPISASRRYHPSAPDRFIAQYQKTRPSRWSCCTCRSITCRRPTPPTKRPTWLHWARPERLSVADSAQVSVGLSRHRASAPSVRAAARVGASMGRPAASLAVRAPAQDRSSCSGPSAGC